MSQTDTRHRHFTRRHFALNMKSEADLIEYVRRFCLGDPDFAKAWIDEPDADRNNWSVTQLREEPRGTFATYDDALLFEQALNSSIKSYILAAFSRDLPKEVTVLSSSFKERKKGRAYIGHTEVALLINSKHVRCIYSDISFDLEGHRLDFAAACENRAINLLLERADTLRDGDSLRKRWNTDMIRLKSVTEGDKVPHTKQDAPPSTIPWNGAFSWFDFLRQDFALTGGLEEHLSKASRLAYGWVTCACGHLCRALPRDDDSMPLDSELQKYGSDFSSVISLLEEAYPTGDAKRLNYLRDRALGTLHEIEARTTLLLARLREEIGPEGPDKDGILRLTEDQFIARYEPEADDHGNVFVPREIKDPEDEKLINAAIDAKCCWTAVEGDNGTPYIEWGNRLVNRLYHIITKRPLENENWIVEIEPDKDFEKLFAEEEHEPEA